MEAASLVDSLAYARRFGGSNRVLAPCRFGQDSARCPTGRPGCELAVPPMVALAHRGGRGSVGSPARVMRACSPSGVPGQCRVRGSGPVRRMTERSTTVAMIASSA
jgi:hypothetical protein